MTAELPPYARTPVTLPDGTPVIGWSEPTPPAIPRCRCSHARSQHHAGVGICWATVCGCQTFRSPVEAGVGLSPDKEIPARFDERYDPSPDPIDRSIQ